MMITHLLSRITFFTALILLIHSNQSFCQSGNIGIGTTTPAAKLDVVGNVKITDGTQGQGKVLKSDSLGMASWDKLTGVDLINQLPEPDFSCLGVVATATTGEGPYSIALNGDFAYVLNFDSANMMVFNISNPAAPTLVATFATGDGPYSIAVNGDFAYVLNFSSYNMMVFNISNPATPTLVATVASGDFPVSIAINGNFAFVLNFFSNDMRVFNISNPAAPALVDTVVTGNGPVSIAVNGNFAFVLTAESDNMMVFNISNPATPALVATVATGDFPYSIAVNENYAFLVNTDSDNMMVFNISNPAAPALLATVATGDDPYSIAVNGNYAFVVNRGSDDMMVFNISNPAAPALVATVDKGDGPNSIAVNGNFAFLVNTDSDNMMVFQIACNPPIGINPLSGEIETQAPVWQQKGTHINTAFPGNVGIGTNSPASKLDVFGGDAKINGLTIGRGPGNISSNTALGSSTLNVNDTGNNNTAVGANAMFVNTSGNENTAVGQGAGQNISTGSHNVAVGHNALNVNTTGIRNTAIGKDANVSSVALSNATAIGNEATVNANNKLRLGNTAVETVEGQVAYTFPSDGRFKENVLQDVSGLDFILKLKPVSYNFNRLQFAHHIKEKMSPEKERELNTLSANRSVGFIAQDVEKIVKDLGFTSFDAIHTPTNDTDNYSLAYAQFVVPLVKAVQEMDEKINTQQKTIEELKQLIEAQKNLLLSLAAKLDKTAIEKQAEKP
ncbi:MAG: tail fiber domain-containing protein [Saprospiraceae bacterium]|nr:tail fiber domain-containing protein [Saprospiraceae bacterium]